MLWNLLEMSSTQLNSLLECSAPPWMTDCCQAVSPVNKPSVVLGSTLRRLRCVTAGFQAGLQGLGSRLKTLTKVTKYVRDKLQKNPQ